MIVIILDENDNIIEKTNDIDFNYINNKINKIKIQANITRFEKLYEEIYENNEYYEKITKDKIINVYILYGEYDYESDNEKIKYVIIITE
jgi:hypothetical protein